MSTDKSSLPIADAVRDFMKLESAGGILLLAAAVMEGFALRTAVRAARRHKGGG